MSGLNQQYDVLVLGAGVVGINCAYYLARLGLEVVVVEPQPSAGMGAAFANGGQISCCHAEPWARPSSLWYVLRHMRDPQAPLHFVPRADRSQWRYLLGFIRECLPRRYRHNTAVIVALALYSRRNLQQLRRAHNLQYQQKTLGILHFYQNRKVFASAAKMSVYMQSLGLERRVCGAEEVLALEPALRRLQNSIVGGTYTPSDESGNAYLFCQQLSQICADMGVHFAYQTQISNWENGRALLENSHGSSHIKARDTVVAMGAYSAIWLGKLGIKINMYPAKGYSLSLPIIDSQRVPQMSLTDDEHKLVISNFGDILRIAGTAELSGYNLDLNPQRVDFIKQKAREYFGDALDFGSCSPWAGLRPTTASSVPIICQSRLPNLWINTGHGTLGWTMSCGSGKLQALNIAKARGIKIPRDFEDDDEAFN